MADPASSPPFYARAQTGPPDSGQLPRVSSVRSCRRMVNAHDHWSARRLRRRADPGAEAWGIGVLGTAEEVALPPTHADPLERFRLFLRLDALRDHGGVHSGAHVEDGLHDLLAHPLVVHVAHEDHVDLQVRGSERGHRLQARVAGADVVDGERETEVHERMHGLAIEDEVLDDALL